MENYIIIAFWSVTALALVLGIVMGAVRGTNRSILRLILVLVSAVAAFFMRNWITDLVLNAQVGETTLQQTILDALGSDLQALGDTVIIMIKVMASAVVFFAVFYLLKLITWMIVYPLCKLFVKKGEKKHRVIGGAIGLVQGVVVALCICIPLGGVAVQANKVLVAANTLSQQDSSSASLPGDSYYASSEEDKIAITPCADGTEADSGVAGDSGATGEPGAPSESGTPDESGTTGETGTPGESGATGETGTPEENNQGETQPSGILPANVMGMLDRFQNSVIGKFYSQTLKAPFNFIASCKATTKGDDGNEVMKTYTLEGQIDAVVGALHMMGDLTDLKGVNWKDEITGDVATTIKNVMDKLDDTKKDLTPEAIETINEVANSLFGAVLPIQVNVSNFDLKEVDFSKEGTLIVNVVNVANKDNFSSTDLKEITDNLAESTLVLPIVEGMKPIDLSSDRKEQVERAFNSETVQGCNEEVLETLRKLFKLTDDAETGKPSDTQTDDQTGNQSGNQTGDQTGDQTGNQTQDSSDTQTENQSNNPTDTSTENPSDTNEETMSEDTADTATENIAA